MAFFLQVAGLFQCLFHPLLFSHSFEPWKSVYHVIKCFHMTSGWPCILAINLYSSVRSENLLTWPVANINIIGQSSEYFLSNYS